MTDIYDGVDWTEMPLSRRSARRAPSPTAAVLTRATFRADHKDRGRVRRKFGLGRHGRFDGSGRSRRLNACEKRSTCIGEGSGRKRCIYDREKRSTFIGDLPVVVETANQ